MYHFFYLKWASPRLHHSGHHPLVLSFMYRNQGHKNVNMAIVVTRNLLYFDVVNLEALLFQLLQVFSHVSILCLDSFRILITIFESLNNTKLKVPNFFEIITPKMEALYSTILFVILKSIQTKYSQIFYLSSHISTLIHSPTKLLNPSADTFHATFCHTSHPRQRGSFSRVTTFLVWVFA